ncbi:hypothetical protein, variant 1 [Aphanomyces invadans]|uniref:Uncharacterized protein n=1 Tax=Aphanomyces invadans TaxID=157072 RepID=A0A024UFP9_9STRA|nr:hypothetical protein, variant 1 [Aphanomyces invadans]ETW04717.1 hypothetical protein, variant 1 [Aphanomyces invadans]|eukprot:XP_008866154.1 hypothetical protein, variant 1 [Aphanomyces invadans]
MSAPATGSSRVRMSLDDSLRLVHDILDEDRSFLEYLHDENVTERDRVHHALHQASVTSTTAIRPEKYINETCHELQHELEQLESELSFYDTMKRTTSSKATRGSGQHEQAHGGGSVAPRARAHPTRQPPKKKTVPAPHTPIVATSFDSMIAKLQRDYEHDKAAHLDAQARIQARVAAAHKDAMVFADMQPPAEDTQRGAQAAATANPQLDASESNMTAKHLAESHVLPDPEERHDRSRSGPNCTNGLPPTQPSNESTSRLRLASMQAIREACSTAIATEADAVLHQGQQKQLQEACDRETHDVVAATKAELGQEHHAELAHVQDEFMAKRRHELNDVLVNNERRLEREKQNVVERYQLETDLKRAALQRQLDVDRVAVLREIEQKYQADLVALEERLRHVVSDELLAKRQEVATALLQREEELLQQGRAQALAMHQANERDEVAKLQEALQLGSSLRLQQLRERLDGQRAAKLAQIERVANESLERSLEHLRNEHDADTVQLVHTTQDRLRQAHDREIDSLRQALAVDETRSLNDVTTQLRANHLKRVERIREEHDLRRADRLAQLQQTYEAEYIVRMETLQEDLNAQLTATLSERAAEHSRALQKEIDTRTQHFADVTDRLTSELHFWFQVVKHQPGTLLPKERRQDDGGEAPDAIAKLNALGITNREVNQWIHTIRSEFFDLSDQHKVLVESLRQASVVASSSKQKVAALEDALARQEAKLDKAMVDIHEKTRLCQRLYNANEQLLKQLPAASPP